MTPDSTSPLLVIGDIGQELDESEWRSVTADRGWTGQVSVHHHPGTGGTPPLEGGNPDLFDPVFALGGREGIGPEVVVVGLARAGTSAQVCGLGGRAGAVVVVDGLGGPFRSPGEQIGSSLEMMREIVADPDSHGPVEPGAHDPRLHFGPAPLGDRTTALRWAESMPVPLLVLETPQSHVSEEDAAAIVGAAPQGQLRRLAGCSVEHVAEAIVEWAEY